MNINAELMTMSVEPFTEIHEAAMHACRLAYRNDRRVGFTFNGVKCHAGPLDEPEVVVDRYHRNYDLAQKERRDDSD